MKQITPKSYNLIVDGISQKQLDIHFALYNGYVNNFNALIADRAKAAIREHSELTRRMGFEYNGIKLHELYFENLEKDKEVGIKFKKIVNLSFGSFDEWKEDLQKVLTMRGIGWAIVYYDYENQLLLNTFIADHEINHLSTLKPLIVIDLWEHAFSVDFLPNERAKYLDIIWKNINWDIVEERI